MAELGFTKFDELVGESSLLEASTMIEHWKGKGLDFTKIFYKPKAPKSEIFQNILQNHPISDVLDRKLIEQSAPALEEGSSVRIETKISNVDRSVGAMLSGKLAERFGHEGLPDDTIAVSLKGTAGQSFGAFLAKGISFDLQGDGNDYVGKGLSGGRIVIRPPEQSKLDAENLNYCRQHGAVWCHLR